MKKISEKLRDYLLREFEGDTNWDFRVFFNKETGMMLRIWGDSNFREEWKDFREKRENYVEIPRQDIKIVHEDMKKFCKEVKDENVKIILQSVLDWGFPFNTFKFVINEFCLGLEWFDFEKSQKRKRFIEWLKTRILV